MDQNSGKIRLKLLGITYNQIESGVYAVVLQEEHGKRRLPIVIGYAEAQAIECELQKIQPPRPLTHDLMNMILGSFSITLLRVDIHRLPNGVFAAWLKLEDQYGRKVRIDARSSDAIALAIRAGAPIFTTREVIEEVNYPNSLQEEDSFGKVDDNKSKEGEATSADSPFFPGIGNGEIDLRGENPIFSSTVNPPQHITSFEDLERLLESAKGNPALSSEQVQQKAEAFLRSLSEVEIKKGISAWVTEEKYELAAKVKRILESMK